MSEQMIMELDGRPFKHHYKFSYSEKRDITTCPHRYELITVRKIPQDFEIRRLLVPNVLDGALDTWIKNLFTGHLVDIAVEHYRYYVENNKRYIRWKHPMDMRDCEISLVDTANKLETAMKQYGLCRSDCIAQKNCKAIITLSNGSEIKLTGRLDLYYDEAPMIYDLKTTDNPKWLDIKQLIFYDFVISHMTGRKVKKCGFLAPMMNPPVLELDYVGKAEWDELFQELNSAISVVTSGQFPDLGNKDEDCFMCFAKWYCKRRFEKGPQQLVQVGNGKGKIAF